MTRRLRSYLTLLLTVLTGMIGCHPTQPFYLHNDNDLSHYLDKATDLDYADVYEPSLAEVEFSGAPLTLTDPEFAEHWDLGLEDVVSIALNNSKVVRNLGGVTPFGFADALVGRTANSASIYDAAINESDPNNGVEAALAAFDAQFSIVGSNNSNIFTQTDRPSTFQPDQVIDRDLGGLRTELAKRTAYGSQLFVRNQTDYTRGDNLLGLAQPVNSVWETQFELEVRQPLLRGRGTQVNRTGIMLARINTDVTLASFESSVRNLVFDIENTYWDLHRAYRALETAKAGRDAAQITWHPTYEKALAGTETAQQEAQAREQYFFFRGALETAQRDLFDTENRLRFLMGIAPTDGRLIRPKDEPTIAWVQFDWKQIHHESLMRSAELRQQKWIIKRREVELIGAKNQLLPQFDVGFAYRWVGTGDELINADRNGIDFVNTAGNRIPNDPRGPVDSNAFDVLTNGFYQEAGIFFNFQMPVGFRSELAGVRNAQLNLVREKARLEDMELNTMHLLSSTLRNLDFTYQNAQTHFNRWTATQAEVESAEAQKQTGLITLDLVLEAQRRRAQAQIDYYTALTSYNKAIADVHYRKGSLLEYNGVYLAEGPWPEKAYWDAVGQARERDSSHYMNYGWTRPKVISQGPIPQHTDGATLHVGDMPLEQPVPEMQGDPGTHQGELIPAPEPDQTPSEEESAPVPITNRPDTPALNAPRQASLSRQGETAGEAYEWGSLGLDQSKNPLR